MDGLRAVLFDVFGTVVDWRGSVIAELSALGAARGLQADWAAVADAWRAAYAPSMDRVRKGEAPWAVLDELHRESLDALAPRFGLDALDESDRARLVCVWHRLAPWPDSADGLTALKRRRLIGSLSNGNLALQIDLARFAGLPWDVLFAADHFQHYKPDPETYLGACRLLLLKPEQVMMAAAHNGDLAAARALGLRTAFIRRVTEHGPGQTTDLEPEQAWDVVAEDVADLAAKLA